MGESTTAAGGLGLYDITMFAYFAAFIVYGFHTFWARKKSVGLTASIILWAAFALHTGFLVQRALFYYDQHQGFVLPATNMFEAIGFFAWLVVLIYLIGEILIKTRAFGVLGMIVPVAAMAYTARGISQDARELMPSLKSYWLVFHITTVFIAYAAFALAFSLAIYYLLASRKVASMERIEKRFDLKFIDSLSYRLVLLGFPMLTLGIFLGAVWADAAWGRYWGWDPKETWSLITWFIYLAFLHLRIQWKWVGYRSALFNIIGFASVLMTFLGVNLLDQVFELNSIHAYAEGGAIFMLIILALGILIPVLLYFMPAPADDQSKVKVDDSLDDFKLASDIKGDPTAQQGKK